MQSQTEPATASPLPDPAGVYATRASIFERLKSPEPTQRELAWHEFFERYKPVIVGFASRCGASPQDIDDIVQDVTAGFFAVSSEFVYNPAKGRFRGWLKTCTLRAAVRRAGKNLRFQGVPLESVRDLEIAVEPVWEDVWEREMMVRALRLLQESAGDSVPYRAFVQYVLLARPADVVAEQIGTSVENVHQSKTRMTRRLREIVARLHDADE